MNIHITGGAGFIGSNLVAYLNHKGITPFVYDRLKGENWRNLAGLSFKLRDQMSLFHEFPDEDVLVHLGASVDTTEKFNHDLWYNNFTMPLQIFERFKKVIYASSGSVYGAEESDFTERIYGLKPLNAYGFTKWALDEAVFGKSPVAKNPHIYALRFFNVYGPNETHKGNMQSVVSKAINKLKPLYRGQFEGLPIYNLFKSNRPDVKDGEQQRDFVYVEDVADVIFHFIQELPTNGIFNLGSGKARSFVDLIKAVNPDAIFEYSDMPETLVPSYQYFTEANLTRLRQAGYKKEFTTLEDGVHKTIALTNSKSPVG